MAEAKQAAPLNLDSAGLTSGWAPPVLIDLEQLSTAGPVPVEVEMSLPPEDQSWFWTPEWQQAEREADEDIRVGRVVTFDNVEDLLDDLDK